MSRTWLTLSTPTSSGASSAVPPELTTPSRSSSSGEMSSSRRIICQAASCLESCFDRPKPCASWPIARTLCWKVFTCGPAGDDDSPK
uniref:Putative secreted peptide n=1 Tax=Anopheles braziliensis TaxID=58242 RepID=A0A2M3ZV20_9DIPT